MTSTARFAELPGLLATRLRSLPFYLVALLLHLLFFLIFGTYTVSERAETVITIFTAPEPVAPPAANVPPPPPPPQDRSLQNVSSPATPTPAIRNNLRAITVGGRTTGQTISSPAMIAASIQQQTQIRATGPSMAMDASRSAANIPAIQLRQRLTAASGFLKSGSSVSGSGRATRARFACYWAIYQGGDWNCNPLALPNLTAQVARWSRDRIQQKTEPQPIVVSSKDLFTIKPPFIFVTGHKDFTFTDEEVENLRQYLHAGGAIWADNDLPGRRSRFDIAFRREMKRVLTDREFEKLPEDHPIMAAYYPLRKLPSGMNFYQEPIEVLRLIADEIAVVYTLNAYGDLWESALDENDKIDRQLYRTSARGGYHKWGPHFGSYYTATHYRNVNDESVLNSYKLGINIVIHLLTRYDDRLRAMGVHR
ncbi:MAG: DUF4159 domain-containing protein [Verrucomicrobia bacterium]|nr:DUF4159 domain-containing protein [Verrucomicrobiota bacterium]